MNRAAFWFACFGLVAQTLDLSAQLDIIGARLNGREVDNWPGSKVTATNQGVFRVPSGTREVQFSFRAGQFPDAVPYRLLYKLEGQDPKWNAVYSHMRMVIRMLDASGSIISATEAKLGLESPGWQGTLTNSPFQACRVEANTPARATRVQLWCVSGGPEYTTGIAAFRNFKARVGEPETPEYREVSFSTEEGVDLDEPLGSLADWRRDGSQPQMAQVIELAQPGAGHALALVDSDIQTFAAWLTPLARCIPVKAGERVVVEWEQAYCVGQGGGGVLTYSGLKAGNYWLRLAAAGMDGVPIAPEVSLNFVVSAPFWQSFSFWLLTGTTSAAAAFWAARQYTRRRMQHEVDRLERQHMLERERTRIARDIHDDLGTSLTQIALLSESARRHAAGSPNTVGELDRICVSVREAVQAMDEIVWAADPSNDSLDELATYISGFAQDLLNTVNVRCRLEMSMSLPEWNLSAEVRHNVFLAFKEALNNALKHGRPDEVRIELTVQESAFTLEVVDNGGGLKPEHRAGHGLRNMRSRLEKIGGACIIEPALDRGTRVRFVVPISAQS